MVSPTGSGKTTIAAALIHSAVAKSGSVLAIAHRRELIDQLETRLAEHGVAAGVIMAKRHREDRPVMVASIQTLVRRELPDARIVLIDEAHHARAKTYETILQSYPEAVVIGLTATPWRLDGRGLSDLFDASVVAATPAELLALGFLCPATGHAYVAPDFGGVGSKGGDYDSAGLSLAYKQSKVLGDIVDRWFAHAGPGVIGEYGALTILFASSIENSLQLVADFQSRGVSAVHLDYNTSPAIRRGIISDLRAGRIRVVSNVGILGEGVDVPDLQCAILARPTKSVAIYLQQVGRVLRPKSDGSSAIIHDHSGSIVTHGLWDQERDYSLTISKQKRPTAAPVRQCPECFLCMPAGTAICPGCGHEFPAADRDPDDDAHKEMTLEELRALAIAKKDRDQLLMLLMVEAKGRGYAPGWVLRRMFQEIGEETPFPKSWWRANVEGQKGAWRWVSPN